MLKNNKTEITQIFIFIVVYMNSIRKYTECKNKLCDAVIIHD